MHPQFARSKTTLRSFLEVFIQNRQVEVACTVDNTVSFHSIRPSRVTGLVAMAEIGCLSHVTGSLAGSEK